MPFLLNNFFSSYLVVLSGMWKLVSLRFWCCSGDEVCVYLKFLVVLQMAFYLPVYIACKLRIIPLKNTFKTSYDDDGS